MTSNYDLPVPDPAQPLEGGCVCGGVRFEVNAPLVSASYCHCGRCQGRTGGATSAQARVESGSFRLTRGEDLLAVWAPGGGFEKLFCSACGAHLFSRNPRDHDKVNIRLGAFDTDPGIRPQWRQFVDYAAPWEEIPDDGLPRYAERPPTIGLRKAR